MSMVFSWRPTDESAPGVLLTICPRCEADCTLHQPDPELVDRLLATCDECKSWFLANSEGIVLIQVPEFPDRSIKT